MQAIFINWSDCFAPHGSIYEKFLNFVVRNGFTQLVNEPTRQHSLLLCIEALVDFYKLAACLSAVDWLFLLYVNLTTDWVWSAFCQELNTAIDQCVSFQYVCTQRRPSHKKSYPAKIRAAIALSLIHI